ncbi:MAG: hypothetical protein KDB79_03810 [Acidobacteria bacterium]|nr:hypothetical protein [Acidobacteriota bacterium]
MRNRRFDKKQFVVLLLGLIFSLSFSLTSAVAQTTPLSLAEVLTGLQSRSGDFTIEEKNAFITQQIQQRGITFRVSTEIESELRRAGASNTLINAAKAKESKTAPKRVIDPNAPPIAEFDKLWVDYNITENGRKGMRVHTKFTLKNLKDESLNLTVRVEKEDGDPLKNSNSAYSNKGGQLAVFKPLKPAYASAIYADQAVFIPYDEIIIEPGKHNLKLDADIIYTDGELLKHFTLHPFTLTKPGGTTSTVPPTLQKPTATHDRTWIDYNVTQNGQKGMVVHSKFTVNNLLNQQVLVAVGIETTAGVAVKGKTKISKSGSLVVYLPITPKYAAAVFQDANVFIPYSEFVLPRGKHKLRAHVDILQPAKNLDLHLSYFNFDFTQP